MKTKIKLVSLITESTNYEQMSKVRGGVVQGTCSCLCDADVKSASAEGCKKAENTGCKVLAE
jgi:hypothetical protein